jgi:hypothetical protein
VGSIPTVTSRWLAWPRATGEEGGTIRDLVPEVTEDDRTALPATGSLVSVFGGSDRRGRWPIAPRCRVINVLGGDTLDLQEAVVESPDLEITVIAVFGGTDVKAPSPPGRLRRRRGGVEAADS